MRKLLFTILLFICIPVHAGVWSDSLPSQSTLVSCWDGEAPNPYNDKCGSNNGTNSGSILVAGRIVQGWDFDGNNDVITMSSISEISKDLSFSFVAWVNTDIMPASRASADTVSVNITASNDRFGIQIFANEVVVGLYNGSSYFTTKGATIGISTWHHIAVSYNGSVVSLWVDNIESFSAANDDPSLSAVTGFKLGARSDSQNFLDGKLDSVAIWSSALTAAQVTQAYNAGRATVNTSLSTSIGVNSCALGPQTNLISCWNGEAPSPYNDKSGSSNGINNGSVLTAGRIGQGWDFDGSSGFIDVDITTALNNTNTFSQYLPQKIISP